MHGVQREVLGAAVCLQIGGAYDDETVLELRRRLEEEQASQVLLDFNNGAPFQDANLAMLVVVLVMRLRKHPESTIRVRGSSATMSSWLGVTVA